jgi:hypothetical protein
MRKYFYIVFTVVFLFVAVALPAQSLSQAADQQFIAIGIHGYPISMVFPDSRPMAMRQALN